MSNKKILILPGDGIGNEVMAEVLKIIDWMEKTKSLSFDISERLVGGTAYDKEGNSISDETMQVAMDCDAVLFGAVGGAKWDNVERDKRPEAALLRLRKDLDLFANLRPAVVLDALSDSSSLKSDLVKGLDILIIRELTSGVYFGQPRGISKISETESKAVEAISLVGDTEGRDILIVDDMTETAGTLCAAAELLKKNGARKVFAAVSHGVLNDKGYQRLADGHLDELITTNTTPVLQQEGIPITVLLRVVRMIRPAFG